MGFKPGEINDDSLSDYQELEFDIDKLLKDIFNDEYILLIGGEVLLDNNNIDFGPSGDFNDYLLKTANKAFKRQYASYNEMMEDAAAIGVDEVRNLLNSKNFSFDLNDISPELTKLLETKVFRMILTTTFDSYLEKLMAKIWGDCLRIVNIEDKESLDSFRNALSKCRNGKKYNEPTLFYIFGKAVPDESKKYVKTDNDAIQIIEKWIKLPNEDAIINHIRSKKILSLGCKFENWYFRFFWYILKREIRLLREGQVAFALNEKDPADIRLKLFLKRSRIYQHSNARQFITELSEELQYSDPNKYLQHLIKKERERGGIFLSHSSKDSIIATQLFYMLKNLGYAVWLDDNYLLGGENYNKEIEEAISESIVFIPLLTPNIANDLSNDKTDNYYNKEWRLAAESHKIKKLNVLPIAVEGYDLRASYHTAFEMIIQDSISGINLMDNDGNNALVRSLDKIMTHYGE